MSRGISIAAHIGIGDGLQFSSLPENYYRATGEKLVDVSKPWFFDNNPFVVRDEAPTQGTTELWNFPKKYEWPTPRKAVYLSNAEIWAALLKVDVKMNRPRLYKFENYLFERRERIIFHPFGKSHGALPDNVIDHVIKKYGPTKQLFQVGLPGDPYLGIPKIETPTLWHLAELISTARMVIGPDSGPSWIGACYPDIVVKKVRVKWQQGYAAPGDWVPLEINNNHSHWDDRIFRVYSTFEEDVGFTESYRNI